MFFSKNKDWNAMVRKNTIAGDPIGSTRASLVRRNRKSLRRQIISTTDKGLSIDTDKLVEYNPKLSDVTPTTRVAYVKFMTRKFKSQAQEEDTTSERGSIKSNVSLRSVHEKQKEVVQIIMPPTEIEGDPVEATHKTVRVQSPILEDPNEDRVLSGKSTPLPSSSQECETKIDEGGDDDRKIVEETKSSAIDEPKSANEHPLSTNEQPLSAQLLKLEVEEPPKPLTPGRSKVTGRNIKGWI